MSENPYSSPQTQSGFADPAESGDEILAGRGTRLVAAIIDGLIMVPIIMVIAFGTGYFARVQAQEASVVEQLSMSLLGLVIFLAVNGYLLFTRGQSVGKMLTSIQIVDNDTGNLLPFVKVYVYRYLWMLPLTIIVTLIPGTTDDLLVNLVAIINVLLIFGGDRRCLHDYIAGSKVVLYTPNRSMAQ